MWKTFGVDGLPKRCIFHHYAPARVKRCIIHLTRVKWCTIHHAPLTYGALSTMPPLAYGVQYTT